MFIFFNMYIEENYIVFPEGDIQEIPGKLRINQMVDINGYPLALPLATERMLAYRVSQIRTKETRGTCEIYHYLEQLSPDDLVPYVKT
ncbi:MAG: hypothetical protein SNJ56_02405 [Termitinemataceae bacterium]